MSEGEAEKVIFTLHNPMAYALEPLTGRRIERPVFAEDEGAAAALGRDGSKERVGNTS